MGTKLKREKQHVEKYLIFEFIANEIQTLPTPTFALENFRIILYQNCLPSVYGIQPRTRVITNAIYLNSLKHKA